MAQMATPQPIDVLPLIRELAYLEQPGWAARSAALRASGIPRNEGEPDPAPDPAPDPEPDPAPDPEPKVFDEAYVKSLRAENAKYRQKAKRADELEAAEETRKQADLSELERERAQREAAEKKAERLERAALRRKVADEHKLDPELAEFLTGDTEEDMAAKAAVLAAKVPAKGPSIPVPGGPQGGKIDTTISADEARRLAEKDPDEFNRRFDAGEIPPSALGGK